MVTLKSINVHPTVRHKLANDLQPLPIYTPHALLARDPSQLCSSIIVTSKPKATPTVEVDASSTSNHGDDQKNEAESTNMARAASLPSQTLPLHMCLNLRAAVADASIIAKYGKEASRVTARISKVMESVIKNGLKFKGQDLDDNGQDNWIGDEKEQLDRMLFHKNRPPAFTVGMCTALDYCIDKAEFFSYSKKQ